MSIAAITGRDLSTKVQGTAQRIYFEEAGQGRPALCLQTAGADTRQWRHLMNDPEITDANRIIAIEASDVQPAWYDIDWFHRTDAHVERWARRSFGPILPPMPHRPNAGTPFGCSCKAAPACSAAI